MGHHCGAKNLTTPGYCARWLVNYEHCSDHRRSYTQHHLDPSADWGSEAAAELLADVLTEGVQATVADRVTDYLGKTGTWMLRRHDWDVAMCQELADTAQQILNLQRTVHRNVGLVTARMLPNDTSRFNRRLVEKIAAKVPLPWDSHLAAVVRGLEIIGIFECTIKQLPMMSCACLRMLGAEMLRGGVNEEVKNLLKDTWEDLGSHGRQRLRTRSA